MLWKNHKTVTTALLALMLFAGCEKIFMPRDTEATPTATFDYLWQQIDERYSLFDVKDVDWNAVRDSLRPRVYDEMSNDSLFAILKKMINTLDDGHVDIWGNYDIASSEQIYLQRYANSNFDLNTVALNYLRADHHTTGGLVYNSIAGGQVLYIRYSSFSNSASTALMQTVINRYPDIKGIVFDIRQKPDGAAAVAGAAALFHSDEGRTRTR